MILSGQLERGKGDPRRLAGQKKIVAILEDCAIMTLAKKSYN